MRKVMTDQFLLIDGDAASLPNAIVLYQSGRIVARVHAAYDFSECPEEYRGDATRQITAVRLGLSSLAEMQQSKAVMTIYRRLRDAYDGLPWYRRFFRRCPTVSSVSDAYQTPDGDEIKLEENDA